MFKDRIAREVLEIAKGKIDELVEGHNEQEDRLDIQRRDIDLILSHHNLTPVHKVEDKWVLEQKPRAIGYSLLNKVLGLQGGALAPQGKRTYTRHKKNYRVPCEYCHKRYKTNGMKRHIQLSHPNVVKV